MSLQELCGVSDAVAHAAAVLRSVIGCRVRRNPKDWDWEDQDGGDGCLGTVLDISPDGWAGVQWDSGVKDGYRMGAEGKFDLLVVEPPPEPESSATDVPPKRRRLDADTDTKVDTPKAKEDTTAAPAEPAAAPVLRLRGVVPCGLGPTVDEVLQRPFESAWDEYPMLRAFGVPERIAADWAKPPALLRETLDQLREQGAFVPKAKTGGGEGR
eukprot:Hpha_TRINITY_DN27455_c0_g1::TRINITY_DN27455_c0_g1_i1::g.193975::m.193975